MFELSNLCQHSLSWSAVSSIWGGLSAVLSSFSIVDKINIEVNVTSGVYVKSAPGEARIGW